MTLKWAVVETRRGARCRVLEGGSGAPLVFFHGAAGLLHDNAFLDELARRYPWAAPELPGYGESTGEELLEDMLDFALHGWDVVDALGSRRPHVVGHSMGGMIAAEMACLAPKDLDKLVLASAAGLWIDEHPIPDIFSLLPFELVELLFTRPGARLGTAHRRARPDRHGTLKTFYLGERKRMAMAGKILFPGAEPPRVEAALSPVRGHAGAVGRAATGSFRPSTPSAGRSCCPRAARRAHRATPATCCPGRRPDNSPTASHGSSADPRVIFLIRHGETPATPRASSRCPTSRCRRAASRRPSGSRSGSRCEGIAQIVASDLARARSTAEHLARATGAPLTLDSLLHERSFGDIRGTAYADLGFDMFEPDYAPPNGETWEVFHARVDRAWARVREIVAATDGHVAVVTHGLVCRSLAARHLALPDGVVAPERWENTSVTIVDAAAPWRVSLLNCIAHLDGLPEAPPPGTAAV